MITASAYCNGDDVFLAWVLPHTPNCWGVSIWREWTKASGETSSGYLDNQTGFESDNPQPHERRPSTVWPFQRSTWTDHGADEGDTITYRIAPMLKTDDGLDEDTEAGVTVGPIAVTGSAGEHIHAFFTRGILLSQFVARRLGEDFTKADLERLKKELENEKDELRAFLTGQLGARLARLLEEAKVEGRQIYAALYELDDDVLIERLKAFGPDAHVVLSNGSTKKRNDDGNADAAAQLENVVDLHRRMLWGEGLGHNKFLVVAESEEKPLVVWTGSTNWATTGLCTQMNNAILIEDEALARVYLEQWKLLRDDRRVGRQGREMHFDHPLVDSNDEPKAVADDAVDCTIWFTRTSDGRDLEAAAEVINAAEHAILFLMFEPGSSGLLQVVQARLSPASSTSSDDLYVHGVVNTLKPETNGKVVDVELVGRGQHEPLDLDVVEPEGIHDLAGWATEVTRRDFLVGPPFFGAVGHAIIHSKILVLDPFTNPVVITGSHNFSHSASAANDENLLIIRNAELAQRYAVNIMSTYQHYRWRAYVTKCQRAGKSPWHALEEGDGWQSKQPEHDRELEFWVR